MTFRIFTIHYTQRGNIFVLLLFILFLSSCRENDAAKEVAALPSSVSPSDCNKTSGFFWSSLRQDCVELFREGRKLKAVAKDVNAHGSVFVVFSADLSKAEMYMPFTRGETILLDKTKSAKPAQWANEQYRLMESPTLRLMEGDQILYEEQPKKL